MAAPPGSLASAVAGSLASGEFVELASDRPVTFFGDTAVVLAGAARALTAGVAQRADRLTDGVDGAAQEAAALGLDVQALGESLGRPRRCHAAACAGRGAASARVSTGVREAPCRADRATAPLALGRSAAAQRVAALGRVGISLDPHHGAVYRGRPAPQAAAPVCLGAGGARPRAPAVSVVSVVTPGPLGVTLREVPVAGRSGHITVRVGDIELGAAVAVKRNVGIGCQLLSLNGVDCRILPETAGLGSLMQMLGQRPVELGARVVSQSAPVFFPWPRLSCPEWFRFLLIRGAAQNTAR